MAAGHRVWLADAAFGAEGAEHPAGTFVVAAGAGVDASVMRAARELGVSFSGVASDPGVLSEVHRPRVGLYKAWHSRVDDQGWTLWLMEQYDFAVDTLHDADIRRGGLAARYDVIVLQSQSPESILRGFGEDELPAPWSGGLGDPGARALRDFVRNGGRLVAIEEATELAIDLLGLGVNNAVERLPAQEFYVPGSIVSLDLERHPLTAGMDLRVHGWYWRSSRAFDVTDPTIRVAARYGRGNPVASGWILGPRHLAGRPAVVEAHVGRGSVVLFGFQPNYRGQTVATWPLLFNALHYDGPTPRTGAGS
jgi:hypothetical protein